MAKAPAPQSEMFQAETSWFHVFKSMIESGDIAKMGGTVFFDLRSSEVVHQLVYWACVPWP